jgi:hypothetical protein
MNLEIEPLIRILEALIAMLAAKLIEHIGRRGRAQRRRKADGVRNLLEALEAEVWQVVHLETFLSADDMVRLRLAFAARVAVYDLLFGNQRLKRPAGLGEALENLLRLPYPPCGSPDVTPHQVGLRAVRQFEAACLLMEAIEKMRRELDGFHPVG